MTGHGYRAVYAEVLGDGVPLTIQKPRPLIEALMRECPDCSAMRARLRRMHATYRRRSR